MYGINPQSINKAFETICSRHRGELMSAYLDWEIKTITGRNGDPIEIALPLFVVDFK